MTSVTTPRSSVLTRRIALGHVGVAAAAIGLGSRVDPAAAQETPSDTRASHPIVGSWLARNPTEPPTASPVSFTADGVMTVA